MAKLKVGDKIKIVSIPGDGYYLHKDTKRVYKKLIARKTSVRIYEIDEWGTPWYQCKFRMQNGKYELHFLSIATDDKNWILVKGA